MATRYIVMVRKPNGMMRIIGNKATRKEAEAVAGETGIIKTINRAKGRTTKRKVLKKAIKKTVNKKQKKTRKRK